MKLLVNYGFGGKSRIHTFADLTIEEVENERQLLQRRVRISRLDTAPENYFGDQRVNNGECRWLQWALFGKGAAAV